MASHDLEKGEGPGPSAGATQRNTSSASTDLTTRQIVIPENQSELEIFQTLVGINFLEKGGGLKPAEEQIRPVHPLLAVLLPSKAAKSRFRNRGLYDRALASELKNRSLYAISHYIISGMYLLQILLAATFTALSAYQRASNVALTVLGALNTVIAGILAWLTGQGMPNRYRQGRDQFREVVTDIEATERTFAEIDYIRWPIGRRLDPIKERDRLEDRFEEARRDQEANYPGKLQSPTANEAAEKNEALREKIGRAKASKANAESEAERIRKELERIKVEQVQYTTTIPKTDLR